MNCIAKHKSPDTRRRGENFKACQEQRHVYLIFAFFLFDLFYVMQEKIQKIFLSFWNSLILSNVCVNINGTRPICNSITRRLDEIHEERDTMPTTWVYLYRKHISTVNCPAKYLPGICGSYSMCDSVQNNQELLPVQIYRSQMFHRCFTDGENSCFCKLRNSTMEVLYGNRRIIYTGNVS